MSKVAVVAESDAVGTDFAGTDVRAERVDPAAVSPDVLDGVRVAFAVGEASLLAIAQHRPAVPIAPIAAGLDRYDIPEHAIDDVVDAADEGNLRTVDHPLLDVAVAGEHVGTAVADVTLLTAVPARISEFGIGSADGWMETVRADGVVVATPLGSAGYARDAGGPALAPGTGLVAVPISAYAMHVRPWVLRPPVSLSVERDEADVTLRLDAEAVQSVPPGASVDITPKASLPLVVPQQFQAD